MTANKIKLQKTKPQKSRFGKIGSSTPSESSGNIINKQKGILDTILNSLTHPFLIIDANDYTIKKYNRKASPDKLPPGTTCYQLTFRGDKPCVGKDHICPISKIKKTKKPVVLEHIHIDKEGNQKVFEVHGFPIFNDTGEVTEIIEYSPDITERKRAEEALKKSEEKHRQFFNSMINGFALHEIIYDETGKAIDYRFLEMNPAFEHLTGLRAADLIGKKAYESLPGLEVSWLKKYSKVALTGEPIHFENHSSPLDKFFEVTAYRPAEGQFACIFSDITERKKAEEALQASEEKYRSIFDTAANLITSVNNQGIIVDCNQRIEKILGYTEDEIIGQSMAKIIAPEYLEKAQESLTEVLNTGFSYGKEYQMVCKDGNRIDVSINSSGLKGPDGKYERTICIINNITERKRMEEDIRITHEKLVIEQVELRRNNTTLKKAESELRTAHEKLITEQVALRAKNVALKEIMSQIESEKKQLQIQIHNKVARIIKPIIRNLEPKIDLSDKRYVKLLENSLDEVTEPFTKRFEIDQSKLSPRELEVCNMIKNGMSSKDIASALNISVYTVHNQRRSIRKKLKIKDNKSTLVTFLRSN